MINPEKIIAAKEIIETSVTDPMSVAEIAKVLELSKPTLNTRFKAMFDCTVLEYIVKKRYEHVLHLTKTTDMSLREISEEVGMDENFMSRSFRERMGKTFSEYRSGL